METKQIIFLLLTAGVIPVSAWLAINYKWAERCLVVGTFLSTAYLVDINFYSMEHYRGDTRGFEFGATDWMVISLILVMLFSPRWRNRSFSLSPPNTGFLMAYFFLALLSVLAAYERVYAGFGVLKILRGGVVFIAAYNYLNDEDDLRFLVLILAGIVALEFVFVLYQRLAGGFRVQGTTPHSNTLAGYINMINMIFFSLLLGDASRSRLYWCILAMGSLIVFATFSRGAIVMMVGGYLLVIILSYKDQFSFRKTRLLMVISLLSLPVMAKIGPSLIDRFINAPEASAISRHLANHAAVSMANEHLFGVGINNYSYVINHTAYRKFIDNPVDRGIVHNIFLLHASEMGWPGLLIFLLMMANFIRIGYKNIGRSESTLISSIAVGITVAVVVLNLQGLLEWFFRQTYITIEFFMLAGFLMALPKVNRSSRRRALRTRIRSHLLCTQKNPAYQS